jgi:choline-sulfatase
VIQLERPIRVQEASARPNILLVMADQLTAIALSVYGNKVCKTPNIDALANRSAVFANAYCSYPLCAPSRFALMTGRLPSRIKAYDNASEFPAAVPTIAHYLRAAGYYTCISGKMHFVGPDQHHGYEDRLTTEIYPADFSWVPPETYGEQDTGDSQPHEVPLGVSSVETIADAGPLARSQQIDYDDEVAQRAIQHLYDWKRYGDGRPLFMTVSFTQPHDPYVTTKKYWDLHPNETIDDPITPSIPLQEMDPHSHALYFHYGLNKFDVDDEIYRRARRGYYGMISYIDEKLGELLQTLEDVGCAGNTVVIFTSDHGDMIGERGLWFKKNLFEPSLRVPMIIHDPLYARPSTIQAPVSLIDLLPTLVELSGQSTDALVTEIEGASLVGLMSEDRPDRTIFAEHIDGATVAPRVMVRRGRYKFVYSQAYPAQLYDLQEDPGEQVNLADSPEYAKVARAMLQRVHQQWDLAALKADVVKSQKSRQFINAAMQQGREVVWEHYPNPVRDHTKFVRNGDRFPDVERRSYLPYSDY